MKEFQSHKQDVKYLPDDSNRTVINSSLPIYQHDSIIGSALSSLVSSVEPSHVQPQQIIGASASLPQISNYFDGAAGSIFDTPPQEPYSSVQNYKDFLQPHEPVESSQFPIHIRTTVDHFPDPQTSHAVPQVLLQSLHNELSVNNVRHTVESLKTSVDNTELLEQSEVQNHQIIQLKSELEFHRMTATNLQKNVEELNKKRQESQSHVDVVKVLVAEKSHLIDTLQKSELMIKAKLEENEELQNRLNASRHRVKQLELEVKSSVYQPIIDHEADQKRIEESVAAKLKEFRESNERIELENNELKVLLNQKKIELENLHKNFDHLSTELHLANVKIAQLSDGTPPTEEVNQTQLQALTQEVAIKQQKITELYGIIDQVNRDKESSDNQYQNYVSHLTREMETLKLSSIELTNENDSLIKREQELLKHCSDLERQIQQQIKKQKIYAEDQKEQTSATSSQEEVKNLTSQITALTDSNESLKIQLRNVEAEKAELGQTLIMNFKKIKNMELQVEQVHSNTPNLTKLMTDFEDKSVAASRALKQNQGLKEQLDEMQRAFITMTNDKMELTEKLQSEMHLCKEMKIRFGAMEVELQEMKEKWHYKEDEMIRLSHENTEQEKKIFQQNIEIDRLRHYESKEYDGTKSILEKELENFKRMIETLTNKINILESERSQHEDEHNHQHEGHKHSHSQGNNHHEHESKEHKCNEIDSRKDLLEEIEMLKMEKSELLKAMYDFQLNKKLTDAKKSIEGHESGVNNTSNDQQVEMKVEAQKLSSIPKSVTPSMATEEALEKLQSRFRRTMLEVADLTEEKQRLEHVVTQLQFETETIGEYITLYQYQRRLLKQKEHERDVQLKSLSADREKINEKLLQLNGLIEKFVLLHIDNVELAKEATKVLDQEKNFTPLIVQPCENMMKLKQETAGRILEILSDIKSANSICYSSTVSVENCSCCLGNLETV